MKPFAAMRIRKATGGGPPPGDGFVDAMLVGSPTWLCMHEEPEDTTDAINIGSGPDGEYAAGIRDKAATLYPDGNACWDNQQFDWCNIPYQCLPAGSEEFTLAILVRVIDLYNYMALIDRDPESGSRFWQWRMDASGAATFIQIVSGVSTVAVSGIAEADIVLLHVRHYSDGTTDVFKDGAFVATAAMPTGAGWGSNDYGLRVFRRIQGDSANNSYCNMSAIYTTPLDDATILAQAAAAGF